ncbi:MAG: Respiratory nitrate reductase gamma chain [Nitrospira sp.]|jgi:nitrate reductase gamma subunit|nr:MAG: Respiratory nitrate reductase gamma chain [Nitrospira sp.]
MAEVHEFFFQIYPYIAGSVFLLGSLLRFERGQYTWTSDSSELLRRGTLRFGSNLFHVGVLFLFLGHFIGLLMPEVFGILGIGLRGHQLVAMISGGLFGFACLIGLVLLIHRRVTEPRIRATTHTMDMIVLVWILLTLSIGLSTLYFSAHELSGGYLIPLSQWARHIITFRGGAASWVAEVPLVYQVHVVGGMTLFALIPFSRLVHIWSGFALVVYLLRPYQVVRPGLRQR